MAPMINPFDAGGHSLAEMTEAINMGQLGLFRFEGITQRSIIIEQARRRAQPAPNCAAGRARHRRQTATFAPCARSRRRGSP